MRRADIVRAFVAALGLGLAGGGGCAARDAGGPAAAPRSVESGEPATLDQAQAQLERARADLAGVRATPGAPTAGSAVSTPDATNKTESTAAPAGSPAERGQSPCGHACEAWSSMKRAVDAICRLAGEGDGRCAEARRTLQDGATRVAGCGCAPR